MTGHGNYYVGQFVKSNKHGQGKMVRFNGDVYDGLWVKNVPSSSYGVHRDCPYT